MKAANDGDEVHAVLNLIQHRLPLFVGFVGAVGNGFVGMIVLLC